MATERAEVEAIYNRYLQRCNEHRFDELDEFVDALLEVIVDQDHIVTMGVIAFPACPDEPPVDALIGFRPAVS